MKFLIINTGYPGFLQWLYAQHPGLENQSYDEQMRVRVESLFGVADFCSSNLRKFRNQRRRLPTLPVDPGEPLFSFDLRPPDGPVRRKGKW